MDSLVIFTAKYMIIIVGLIAVILTLLSEKTIRNRIITIAIISFLIALGIASISGSIYYDTRPFVLDHITPLIPHSADNGFPSDHTLYSTITAATIFIFKRKTGILLEILAVLIGVARVAAGVHHPVDIIGGVAIGILATFIGWIIVRILTRTRVFSAWLGY